MTASPLTPGCVALRLLAERYHVGAVRVDASGELNGPLLRAGSAGPVALELTAVERLRRGHVWLRYDVRDGPGG